MRLSVAGTALPLAAAMSLLLATCSASPQSLESATEEKPGVIKVEASEGGGEDDIPFATSPKHLRILMDADASATQIMAVFDAYEGDIDDDEIELIEVVLEGPKRATLATGQGIHATDLMVDDLIEARDDDTIIKYRREAYPTLPSVYLTMAPADFDQVVAVADRYRNVDEIEDVEVESGDFYLVRDEINEDPSFTEARERFVHRVSRRFRLTGAVVAGRGPLKLIVSPTDRTALLEYVDAHSRAQTLGRIALRTKT
jgi:hypothetical protein